MSKKAKRRNARRKEPPIKQIDGKSVMTEIELELEQQRARKRVLSEEREKSSPEPPPKILGAFRYDADRNTYFPLKAFPAPTPSPKQPSSTRKRPFRVSDALIHTASSTQSFPVSWIGTVMEHCTSSRRRRDLSLDWSGRLLAHSTTVVPTVIQTLGGWKSMLPPLKRSPYIQNTIHSSFPWDITCKTNLAPATRTFDVLNDGMLATLVEGGFFVRRPPLRTWTKNHYLKDKWKLQTTGLYGDTEQVGHALRLVSHQLLVVRNAKDERVLDFVKFFHDNNEWTSWSIESEYCGIHDFVVPNDSLVAFAPRMESQTAYVTLFHDFHKECSIHMERKYFGSSDSMCVESMGQNVVHGHRDGGLTLIDRRCKIPVARTKGDAQGSITGLTVLDDFNEILAKRSFGPVMTYDMRMVKVSRELSIPSSLVHPTLSTCCVGVALDPARNIVISPFSDSQRQVHLAIWSLRNGTLIGTKKVSCTQIDGLPHFELRQTITPAWKWTRKEQSNDFDVTQCVGRWGLWFKSGTIEPTAPNYMGSIHHIHLPGSRNQGM